MPDNMTPMTSDEKDSIYKAGFSAGQKHDESSPKTLELINCLQKNDSVFSEKIDNFIGESRDDRKKILDQVLKINSTVADIQKWRFIITGGLIVMNVIFVPIIIALVINNFI